MLCVLSCCNDCCEDTDDEVDDGTGDEIRGDNTSFEPPQVLLCSIETMHKQIMHSQLIRQTTNSTTIVDTPPPSYDSVMAASKTAVDFEPIENGDCGVSTVAQSDGSQHDKSAYVTVPTSLNIDKIDYPNNVTDE